MLRYFAYVTIAILIFTFPSAVFPQDEEEIDFNSGTVIAVKKDSNEIVVNQYDWDSDVDIEVCYAIAPDARVENTDSWQNIKPSSYVDFEFMIENSKKTIVYISVYEATEIE